MKLSLSVMVLCIIVLAGCRAVEAPEPQLATSQEVGEQPTPIVIIESLDSSIPLGDSFPIVVRLENAPANQQVEFELVNGDIIPSTSKIVANTDASGQATIRLTGRSTRAELNALYARAYLEGGGEVVGELYVNFEPPQLTSLAIPEANLEAQAAEPTVGEPITFDQYVNTLPVANSLDDLKTASANSLSGVRIQGVRFPEENGELGEPLDALEFSSGQQIDIAVQPEGSCKTTTTHVYLKTTVDGEVDSFPTGTKVFISGSGTTPNKTTYTAEDGKISFPFGCSNAVYIRVQALSNTGIQIVTGSDENGYPLLIWSKTVKASTGKVLTAEGLAGDTVQLSTFTTNSTSRATQAVYRKVEQARQWEMSTHSFYGSATFPIAVVYPDRNPLFGSRAHYGRMFIEGGSSDRTLYHEFGHEVYYRRLLGADQYLHYHRRATQDGAIGVPICAGYFNGWEPWKSQERCEAMLEGFADWFMTVYWSVAIKQDVNYEYRGTRYNGSPADLGDSVPGNVAAFLWDITDLAGTNPVRDYDNDEVRVTGTAAQRYARVAGFFHHHNTNEDFAFVWQNRIKTQRPASQIPDYCKVARRNTITASGCP